MVALALVVTACGGDDESLLEAGCDGYTELIATSKRLPGETTQDAAESAIVLTHADGRDPEPITDPDVFAADPSFAPDGEALVFVRAAGGAGDGAPQAASLWTVAIDGGELTQLTGGPGWDGPDTAGVVDEQPDWGSDGIVFTRTEGDRRRLHLVRPGEDAALFLDNEPHEQDTAPSWSPTGSRIAFIRTDLSDADNPLTMVWTVNADGSDPRRMAAVPDAGDVSWVPDRSALLVGVPHPGATEPALRTVGLATSEVSVVAPSGAASAWSTDGQRLHLFTRPGDGAAGWRLTTVRMAEGTLADVRQSAEPGYFEHWQSSGLDVVTCLTED